MSQILIREALDILEAQERLKLPPSLAILGPPGSGKSLFLKQLFNTICNDESSAAQHSLMVDLRDLPVGSQNELYAQINQALLQEADRSGISLDTKVEVIANIPDLRFEEILRQLVSSVEGYLIIFIDHLESVPQFFASDLSHRFRNFLETTEEDSAYARLGLVVAGAVSLFELKHGPNSAFQMLKVMAFPPIRVDIRRHMVEDYLKNFMSEEIPAELTELLAELTGGEPAFLEPLMMNLVKGGRQISLDKELVLSSVEEICSYSQVPVLRNLAFHLWGDRGLRDIVQGLNHLRPVMPRFAVPDIDHYQLSGAVVLGRGPQGKAGQYQFRNRIALEFLNKLYDLLESKNGNQTTDLLIWSELEKLEAAKDRCLHAPQIWTWTHYLREAWVLITPYVAPNVFLYATTSGTDSGWWLDTDLKGISGPELRNTATTSTQKAAFYALDNIALSFGADAKSVRAFVESDIDRISIAIPLYAREITIIMVATLSRTDAQRGFTEFDLCHWIQFLQNVKQVVPTLLLAEFGKKMLAKPDSENEQSTVPLSITKTRHIGLSTTGAWIKDPGGISEISGSIKTNHVEAMNTSSLNLVDKWTDQKNFEDGLQVIASQLESALKLNFPDLANRLVHDLRTTETVIATNADGLKIPFELFSHAKSHLALLTGLSRQIIGYQLERDVAHSFDYLVNSLAADRRELRVLLISSSSDPSLVKASEELQSVRSHIEAGCRNQKLRIVEIQGREATIERVEDELTHNGPYHIVHYCGHGRHRSEDPDASGVVLLGKDGDFEVVKCRRLRDWFTRANPWLVYLSCCHSSAVSGGQAISSRYLGMIEATVAAGVQNVVGFRCLVSDKAALHLAAEFYLQLFEVQTEKNLSLAMLEARRSVEKREDFFDAWASSMLITQYS